MNVWNRMGLLSLMLMMFQACGGPFQANNLYVLYRYREKPDFFYDLKLLKVEVDAENRQEYTFDLAISYAQNPFQEVNYSVQYSTIAISGVCEAFTASALNETRHRQIKCKIPAADALFLQLSLVGPNAETTTDIFAF